MNTRITLERDARYAEAKTKLVDLQLKLKELEAERDIYLGKANDLTNGKRPQKSRLDIQAEALLGGSNESVPGGFDSIRNTYTELTEKIAIHKRAIELHKSDLNKLTVEISREIALEVLPQHTANVKAIVKAVLELEHALADEHNLRDRLYMEGISNTDVIRPMPFRGVGLLKDNQSYISRYLLECLEFGFITKKELPESLHSSIPSKGEPAKQPLKHTVKAGDWLSLN